MKKILLPLLVLALLCVGFTAGAEGNQLLFDKTVNLLFEGETLQTVLTREGEPAEGELTYTSSNTKVATIDENGVITGLTKGTTTITATVKQEKKTFRAQLNVTVARKVTALEVNTEKLCLFEAGNELVAGLLKQPEDPENPSPEEAALQELSVLVVPLKKTVNLQVSILPKDATNRKAVLTSSDEEILTVRGTGISAKAPGEAVLTVANELSPEVCVRYRVLVVQPVTRLEAAASDKSVNIGGQISLSVKVQPETASIPQVIWTSANEGLATVDAGGVLTGIKRGNVRIVATAVDGSGVRANLNVKVVQPAEEITLDKSELTVDTGKTGMLNAQVLPKDTDDKTLIWTSSDESVATVNKFGRVTGVALGTCEITCTSVSNGEVKATAVVRVQQPVTKLTLDAVEPFYVGETAKLTAHVEPENASNQVLSFSSSNDKILTVDSEGVITPVKAGETYVNAVTTDGSNRRARVKVKVLQHVTGVRMLRSVAYVDKGESAATGAILEPADASDDRMTWVSENPEIATVKGEHHRPTITGRSEGTTKVTGTTLDGGYTTSIVVRVGPWDKALELRSFDWNEDILFWIDVRNNSDVDITSITVEIDFFDISGDEIEPIPVNTKDGSNTVKAVWKKTLEPKGRTRSELWKMIDYSAPSRAQMTATRGVVRIVSYEINHDWIKTIRKYHWPELEW